jgi:hypothetical protein
VLVYRFGADFISGASQIGRIFGAAERAVIRPSQGQVPIVAATRPDLLTFSPVEHDSAISAVLDDSRPLSLHS